MRSDASLCALQQHRELVNVCLQGDMLYQLNLHIRHTQLWIMGFAIPCKKTRTHTQTAGHQMQSIQFDPADCHADRRLEPV